MTIETPSADDFGTWRCTVGMEEWSGTTKRQSTPMQALIRVAPRDLRSTSAEKISDEPRTLFVEKGSNLMIMCRADVSLAYCWFQHPNGTQFTPVERQTNEDEEHDFWYTGESLQTGDCGITFAHVSDTDVGEWICHMGPKDELGVEVTDRVIVRVTGPLAANKQEMDVTVGGEATIHCHTSNGPRPLDYCRFLAPNYVGFSLDTSVTHESPVLGRFYFTPERSLDYGDCSLTINPVQSEDIGTWTCAGLVHDHTQESRDSIVLVIATTTGRSPVHKAGIAAMSIAIIALAISLLGFLWYKKGRPIPCRRNNVDQLPVDAFSLDTPNSSPTPRSSNDSGNSNELQPSRLN